MSNEDSIFLMIEDELIEEVEDAIKKGQADVNDLDEVWESFDVMHV